MRRALPSLLVALALLVSSLAVVRPAAAQDAAPAAKPLRAADLGLPELAVGLDDAGLRAPASVPAGRYLVTFANATDDGYGIELTRPPAELDEAELLRRYTAMTDDDAGPDAWAWIDQIGLAGGTQAAPGATAQVIADLAPGRWVLVAHAEAVRIAVVEVTGEMPASLPEVAAVATVVAKGGSHQYDFAVEGAIPSGPQVVKVVNGTDQVHFVATMVSPVSLTDEQFLAFAAAFEPGATPAADAGLPPLDQIVEGPGYGMLSPGAVGWWIADFAPGNYTLLCFISDVDGTPHAMEGMIEHIVVE